MSNLRRSMMMAGRGSLPAGYTQLEYIETLTKATTYYQHNAAIDTGVIPNGATDIECKFYTGEVNTSRGQEIFSSRKVSGSIGDTRFMLSTYKWTGSASGGYWYIGDSGQRDAHIVIGDNIFIKQGTNVYINGENQGSAGSFGTNTNQQIRLFMCNVAASPYLGGGNSFSGKIYYCKIWQNGELVRNFIPCIDNNNEYGMYDSVGKQFYGSINSYKFTGQ